MDRKSARMLQPGDSVEVKLEGDTGWYPAKVTSEPVVRDAGLSKIIDIHVALLNGKRFMLTSINVRKPRN